MPRLFNPDSPIQSFLSDLLDFVLLNLITVLCAAPVLTAGASFGALFAVMRAYVVDLKPIRLRDFFASFRSVFLRATLSWIALLAVVLVYIINIRIVATMPTGVRLVFVAGLNFFLFCAVLTFVSLVATVHHNVQTPIITLWKKSFLQSVAHLPAALLIALIQAVPVLLFLILPSTFLLLSPAWLLIWFSLASFISIKLGKQWLFTAFTNN